MISVRVHLRAVHEKLATDYGAQASLEEAESDRLKSSDPAAAEHHRNKAVKLREAADQHAKWADDVLSAITYP